MTLLRFFDTFAIMKALNRIKAALAEQNVKAKDLSKLIDVSESTISGWSSNRSQPSIVKLYAVANALNISVCRLLIANEIKVESDSK